MRTATRRWATLLAMQVSVLYAGDLELVETNQLPMCHSLGWVRASPLVKDQKGWDGVLDEAKWGTPSPQQVLSRKWDWSITDAQWQTAVQQLGEDKREDVRFDLWIPEGVTVVKGLVVMSGHGSGETLYRHPELRKLACELHLALFKFVGNPMQRGFLPKSLLYERLKAFGEKAGHAELANAPLFLYGHSNGTGFSALFPATEGARVWAWVSMRPGITFQVYQPGAAHVPGLVIFGEDDPFFARPSKEENLAVVPQMRKKHQALWNSAVEPKTGHGPGEKTWPLVFSFLRHTFAARVPPNADPRTGPVPLNTLQAESGYFGKNWDPSVGGYQALETAPYASFKGEVSAASWLVNAAYAADWQRFQREGYVKRPEDKAKKPNIILFLVDDMGWMDCGAYGSKYYETPQIDRFATQAMRFTDAYAQPLCSPTRASILSGQYSARHGVTSATGHLPPQPLGHALLPEKGPAHVPLLMPESKNYLDPSVVTLAEALHASGYRTAHVGKWHLGTTEPHWPEAQGFDVAFHCHPDPGPPGEYFSPYGVVPPGTPKPVGKNVKYVVGTITDGPPGEYITDRITDEALKFIDANRDRPFFLNLWQYGVHGPWGHKPAYTAELAKRTDPRGVQGNPIMAAMLKSVDESLGRILAKLDELRLADDTIVIFYSDNGGNTRSNTPDDSKQNKIKPGHPRYAFLQDWRKWAGDLPPTCNLPLRDGKGQLYEGGIRVPLMVRWPGRIEAGSTSGAVVGCIDLYPTILDLLGMTKPPEQTFDGVSFAPVLLGKGALPRDAYFTWFPHLVPGVSVRQGDWKLIRRFQERPDLYKGTRELFNLKDDLGETKNLAAAMPEKVRQLDALIDAFVRDTGALYPKPNPAFKKPDRADGLVPKACTATVTSGALLVKADGKEAPFLGTAQVKHAGALTLMLRVKSAAGGPGRVQWMTEEQTEFPKTGQTAAFELSAIQEWQDVSVAVPVHGALRIARLYLPADRAPVEIASIRWLDADGNLVRMWAFDSP